MHVFICEKHIFNILYMLIKCDTCYMYKFIGTWYLKMTLLLKTNITNLSDGYSRRLTDEELELLPLVECESQEFMDWVFDFTNDQEVNVMLEKERKENEYRIKAQQLGLPVKSVDAYVKTHVGIWEKEQKQKAEDDAKLLGTAMQQLLPNIFEEKRAIPNCFLRGALFGMVRKGRRAMIDDEPVFSMSQYEVRFTGKELDQNDLEVWDTLIYLAKNRQTEHELRLTIYDLCQTLRLKYTNTSRDAVIERVKRLKIGTVDIRNKNGKSYFGSLIDDGYVDINGDGKLVVRFNKRLAPLFTDDYTYISADIRHLLGGNQLARWLYNFYESHEDPIPFDISFIHKLCRSESELKGFKQKLKISLENVKKAHVVVNQKSKWDYEINSNNYLIISPNGKTKKQLSIFKKF
jgi:hypothetical protein